MIPLPTHVDLSVKKTWWEMCYRMSQSDQDPSIPCGRIRIQTERSELNERLLLKDARHRYSLSGIKLRQDSNLLKRNTVPVPKLYRELDVDNLKPYYVGTILNLGD